MRRRDFLRATAVGAGVSLLEGCGGEREEFLVQVARRPGALQGESIWLSSVCGQCPAGCGIQVRVVDGNAKKIEGVPDHPVSRGGVCALGHSALQELYNPDRFTAPQRRSGAPGEGAFAGVSWEEALAGVVDAIGRADPARIALVGGDPHGFPGVMLRRLAAALGAPPPAFVTSPVRDVERAAARLALGVADVPYFDLGNAGYVLSIGAPMLDRWHSPVHYTAAVAHMRRGRLGRRGRLAVATPRMSLTAANADDWLPLRPGTEGFFARAVAGVFLELGRGTPQGRAAYERLCPGTPPTVEEAAEVCDVDAATIARVARELADAESAVVVAGGSAAATTNGVANVAAGLGLNLLLGSLGRPGGVYAPASFHLAASVAPPDAPRPLSELFGPSGSAADAEVLLVAEVDVVHRLPPSWGVAEALDAAGTVVTLSSFPDDTALHADLVLPLTTELERFNAVEPAASVGAPVLSVSEAVVEPLGDAHHPVDVILAVAAALGEPVAGRFPWTSFAALARERIEAEAAFLTGDEAASGSSVYFDAMARGRIGDATAPRGTPPGPSGTIGSIPSATFEGMAAAYPFELVPFESLRMGDGRGANRPWLQEMPDPLSTVMWGTWVEISPTDAERAGVRDGDVLRVESPAGAVEAPAVVDPAVRPGLVGMPLGEGGYRDYGRYARGRGADARTLLGRATVEGADALALTSTRVRIERVGAGGVVRFGRGYRADDEAGAASGEGGS